MARWISFSLGTAFGVFLLKVSTKAAAAMIYEQMQKKEYSTKTWSAHELHPKAKDESTVAFIFTMDLLNFSFWSELDDEGSRCADADRQENPPALPGQD